MDKWDLELLSNICSYKWYEFSRLDYLKGNLYVIGKYGLLVWLFSMYKNDTIKQTLLLEKALKGGCSLGRLCTNGKKTLLI